MHICLSVDSVLNLDHKSRIKLCPKNFRPKWRFIEVTPDPLQQNGKDSRDVAFGQGASGRIDHELAHQVLACHNNYMCCYRVARFLLVQTYQKEKNIPNNHKIYQTAIYYSKWS
jgi:hypothetical protein